MAARGLDGERESAAWCPWLVIVWWPLGLRLTRPYCVASAGSRAEDLNHLPDQVPMRNETPSA
jgi:hypothetical protein